MLPGMMPRVREEEDMRSGEDVVQIEEFTLSVTMIQYGAHASEQTKESAMIVAEVQVTDTAEEIEVGSDDEGVVHAANANTFRRLIDVGAGFA